jgi:mannose-6-phosphate isomerase-like protein (cupin superfamily)
MNRTKSIAAVTLIICFCGLTTGCLTPHERFALSRQPANEHFAPVEFLEQMPPAKGCELVELRRAPGQTVCLLRIAAGSELTLSRHRRTDITLIVLSGAATLSLEDTRYAVTPGQVATIPRMSNYALRPVDGADGFAALVVFSPSYDPKDIRIVEE